MVRRVGERSYCLTLQFGGAYFYFISFQFEQSRKLEHGRIERAVCNV